MRVLYFASVLLFAIGSASCSKKANHLPAFHPVKGVVQLNGQRVNGGELYIRPEESQPNLVIMAQVGNDGSFEVFSMDTQDREGKKLPGAPEGNYELTYAPPNQDQTEKLIELASLFAVQAKSNEWVVELKERKK